MITKILQEYWHFDAFRPMQEDIIRTVLSGKDVLGILPTGGGKSLCYQIPGMAREGLCLVISPLIALMQDQVQRLQQMGIPAAAIYTGMPSGAISRIVQDADQGALKLLYVSPERIQSKKFQEYLSQWKVHLIAIDEAHCISQWGHDFRPAYRKIVLLKQFFPKANIIALTATATPAVQQDIIDQLQLSAPEIFRKTVTRPNLFYHNHFSENKATAITDWLEDHKGSGILYARSRRRSEEMAMQLRQSGLEAGVYHAGMDSAQRAHAQKLWMQSNAGIMCATTAFGMGIDKPNVRAVAHYDVPESIEEYYQEAGRAGRDGQKAFALLYYNNTDIQRLQNSTELNFPPEQFIRKIYGMVGDYLQLPIGSGSESLFPFDALRFIKNFGLTLQPALNTLRLIEREGIWQWNEDSHTRTTVRFITNQSELRYLEQTEPVLHKTAVQMLRMYGSIYHFSTAIDEFDLAKALRIDQPTVARQLRQLDALQIISYQPALTGGSIYWLHNRVKAAHLPLQLKTIDTLREAHRERCRQMIRYLNDRTICRNVLLARYFGEKDIPDCGGCDVCLQKNIKPLSKDLKKEILAFIREVSQISIQALTSHFAGNDAELVVTLIRNLNEEGLCRITNTGVIFSV